MGRNRAIALLIGVAVCVPLLLLHQQGFFRQLSDWLAAHYAGLIKPAEAGLKPLPWLEYGYYTVLAFSGAWVCLELDRTSRKVGFLLGAVFLTVTLSPLLALSGVLFEPFSGCLAVVVAGLLAMVVSGTEKWRMQQRLRPYFVGRLSQAEYGKLVRSKADVEGLTGRREITVLICRLINHAELAGEMEPAELERFSSSFLKVVAEFLVGKGGYLEACNVHRVRVLFGYPVTDPAHAATAAEVALELRQRIVNLTREMEARWHKVPRIGVALQTGEVTCGLFGFSQFEFFTAVGDAIGFADRLCPVNAVYGSQVLLGSATRDAAEASVEVRPMEMVFAPRLTPVTEVYELLALDGGLSEAEAKSRDAFWEGVVRLRKGAFAEAMESFEKARIEGRDDAPLEYFYQRAEEGAKAAEDQKDSGGSTRHVRMLLPS